MNNCKIKYSTLLIAALVSCFLVSTGAFALVEAEISAGQRTQKFLYDTTTETGKSKAASGSEITASLLVDPFPMFPIGFGLTVQSSTIDTTKVTEAMVNDMITESGGDGMFDVTAKTSVSTLLYGPVVKIWAPTPFVKPYLKFAYLMGNGATKVDLDYQTKTGVSPILGSTMKGSQKYSQNGTDLDLGLGFSPIKFFTLFLEYAIHTGTSKVTDQTLDNTDTSDTGTTTSTASKEDLTDDDKKATKANATAIRLGLNFNF